MDTLKRTYTMADSELTMFASEFVDVLTDFASDLEEYGVTFEKIEAFNQLQIQFNKLLPDDFYAADVTDAIMERNAKRKDIARMIQSVMVRVQNVIPDRMFRYKPFAAAALKDLPIADFMQEAEDFSMFVAPDLAALASENVTSQKLAAIDAAAAELRALSKNVRKAMDERAVVARRRVELGNQVYALVQRYAGYGKDCYRNIPAKYNQFIIYANADVPKTPPKAGEIAVIEDTAELILPQEVKLVRMYIKFNEDEEYKEFYSGVNKPVSLPKGHRKIYLKGQAHNAAGWGNMSEKVVNVAVEESGG